MAGISPLASSTTESLPPRLTIRQRCSLYGQRITLLVYGVSHAIFTTIQSSILLTQYGINRGIATMRSLRERCKYYRSSTPAPAGNTISAGKPKGTPAAARLAEDPLTTVWEPSFTPLNPESPTDINANFTPNLYHGIELIGYLLFDLPAYTQNKRTDQGRLSRKGIFTQTASMLVAAIDRVSTTASYVSGRLDFKQHLFNQVRDILEGMRKKGLEQAQKLLEKGLLKVVETLITLKHAPVIDGDTLPMVNPAAIRAFIQKRWLSDLANIDTRHFVSVIQHALYTELQQIGEAIQKPTPGAAINQQEAQQAITDILIKVKQLLVGSDGNLLKFLESLLKSDRAANKEVLAVLEELKEEYSLEELNAIIDDVLFDSSPLILIALQEVFCANPLPPLDKISIITHLRHTLDETATVELGIPKNLEDQQGLDVGDRVVESEEPEALKGLNVSPQPQERQIDQTPRELLVQQIVSKIVLPNIMKIKTNVPATLMGYESISSKVDALIGTLNDRSTATVTSLFALLDRPDLSIPMILRLTNKVLDFLLAPSSCPDPLAVPTPTASPAVRGSPSTPSSSSDPLAAPTPPSPAVRGSPSRVSAALSSLTAALSTAIIGDFELGDGL